MNVEQADKLIQEKIDSLEQLPGEVVFEQTEAWHKLEQRLHRPKKKSFTAFKMAAAACLLVVILCGAIYLWKSDLKNELHYTAKKLNTSHQSISTIPEGKMIAATTHHLQPDLYDLYTKPSQNRKKKKVQPKQLQTPSRAEKKKNPQNYLAAISELPVCYLSGSEYAQPGYYP